jgi:hypothetical protein
MRRRADRIMRHEMVRFVIIFEGRNGSSQLVSMLNAHHAILCYPEILVGFNKREQAAIITAVIDDGDVPALNKYARADRYFHGGFAEKWSGRPFAAVGFKSKLIDVLNLPAVLLRLQNQGFRLIYLCRGNPLKAVISFLNGKRLEAQTGGWNAEKPTDVMGPILVDCEEFDNVLIRRILDQKLHKWFFEQFCGQKIQLSYEDLIEDQNAFTSKLLCFLGQESEQLVGLFYKNTPARLRDAVINYVDLEAKYRHTEYAKFLDD